MIVIVDYGLGNLTSVNNALNKLGIQVAVSGDLKVLKKAQALILPGVGAARQGMENLKKKGLARAIIDQVMRGKPFLGICLGMQLLFKKSEEGDVPCLGILEGEVKKFQKEKKVPQIGWNQVYVKYLSQIESRDQMSPRQARSNIKCIFKDIPNNSYFYFVNSYYCIPKDKSIIAATTIYGEKFCSVVIKDNIIATQFHPEKSGSDGQQLIANIMSYFKQFNNRAIC